MRLRWQVLMTEQMKSGVKEVEERHGPVEEARLRSLTSPWTKAAASHP